MLRLAVTSGGWQCQRLVLCGFTMRNYTNYTTKPASPSPGVCQRHAGLDPWHRQELRGCQVFEGYLTWLLLCARRWHPSAMHFPCRLGRLGRRGYSTGMRRSGLSEKSVFLGKDSPFLLDTARVGGPPRQHLGASSGPPGPSVCPTPSQNAPASAHATHAHPRCSVRTPLPSKDQRAIAPREKDANRPPRHVPKLACLKAGHALASILPHYWRI